MLPRVAGSSFYLVQAAARRPAGPPVRVWAVTAGAQPVEPDAGSDPVQSMIWGLGRTIVSEHQELWGGLLDLDPRAEPQDAAAAQILRALAEPRAEGEDQVAVRGRDRFVPRLRRFEPLRRAPFACSPDAAYLITGGLGGLGLEVARWLASREARHLVLLGRTALPPRDAWNSVKPGHAAHDRIGQIRALEARASRCTTRQSMSATTDSCPPSSNAIGARHGHRSGAWFMRRASCSTGRWLRQTDDDLREIFRSKVAGGWNLHREFRDALDFFVLFSSAASILNSPLVGSYAAANAFLDGLAHWRRAQGAAALSINWGAWTQVGMGARFALANPEDARDTDHAFSPDEGIAAMERLMSSGVRQATVLGVDWNRWRDQYPQLAVAPFMRDLMPGPSAAVTGRAARHQGLALALLAARTGDERIGAATSYIAECVGAVLGLAPDQVDVALPISNLGFDSMMALELKNRISRELKLVVPLVRFLDGPSVGQLARLLSSELGAREEPTATGGTVGAAPGTAPGAWEEGEI